MPLPSNRILGSLLLCISTLTVLTLRQHASTALIIASSTLLFSLAYGVLLQTRLLHPTNTNNYNALTPAIEAEWRSRIVGALHAVILTTGSILCFYDWRLLSYSAGWTSFTFEHAGDLEPGQLYPWFFAAVFGGFLQYDLCWIIYHFDDYADSSALIHHGLFLAVTHYNLHYLVFTRPFAWLSFTELSTPFLHLRWYLAVTDQKESGLYLGTSAAFAGTFLTTRVGGYTWGLFDMWWNGYEVWGKSSNKGALLVVVALHLGWLLNLFWGVKVAKALGRALKGGAGRKENKLE